MRIPRKPPDHRKTLDETMNSERVDKVFNSSVVQAVSDRYLHWDELRHLTPPGDLSHEEWWLALKFPRQSQRKASPLTDTNDQPFNYVFADPIPEQLLYMDQNLAGMVSMPDAITNTETKDRYLINSLIEEATTSSQLEGAATTRLVARELIRSGRPPRDRSERMIVNNFRTMQRIGKIKNKPLSKELIFEIHEIVTRSTLDIPSATGRFRNTDENINIRDDHEQILHTPPHAELLETRMEEMCKFANGNPTSEFIHPVLRSIILHFWLAYDHPFYDGNGRTARALFYWSMLHNGYWLCEFISISEIIKKGPSKYGRAFLYTETDDNDLTYFIVYHLDVLRRATKQLYEYIERKTNQLHSIELQLEGMTILNRRQQAVISHALIHPKFIYTIVPHRSSHGVVYQTARTDLLNLADRGLFTARKNGKEWQFIPEKDLEQRLAELT